MELKPQVRPIEKRIAEAPKDLEAVVDAATPAVQQVPKRSSTVPRPTK